MRVRNVVMVLVAVALVAGATATLAGPGGSGPGMHGRGPGEAGALGPIGRALHRLDLTDAQRTQVEALVAEARPAIADLREQLRASREAFEAAHPSTSFDEAAIRAFEAEQAATRADLAVATARLRSRVLAVLTPEQLARLEAMRGAWRDRGGPAEGGPHGGPWH